MFYMAPVKGFKAKYSKQNKQQKTQKLQTRGQKSITEEHTSLFSDKFRVIRTIQITGRNVEEDK